MRSSSTTRSALTLCLALLLGGSASAGENITSPTPESPSSTSSDNLATVLLQMEASRSLVRQVNADVRNAQDRIVQTADIVATQTALANVKQRLSETHQAESSLSQLMELESLLAGHAEDLHQAMEASTRSIGELEFDLDRLSAESQRWETLLALANQRMAPARLIEQAQRITTDLATERAAVYPVRNQVLEHLTQLISLQQDFTEVKADLTIKVTGNQWFWSYEYPDEGVSFDSFLLPKDQLAAAGYDESLYLLATDTAVVVPVGKTVLVQVTGADVIHSWKVPAFGVMQDAVPGRLAQTWFKAEKEGIFFGQCSEICGKDHAFMPITVKVVSEAAYAKWLEAAKAGNVVLAAN